MVDDEKNVLKTLKIGLKRKAFQVYEAATGQEALHKLQDEHFDILLSDIRMKPMDGYTLAENARLAHPGLGIILMSAYGFEENQYTTMEKLSCSRITKPFAIDELINLIQREINKGRQGGIMVLGDIRSRKSIREVVEAAGYHMIIVNDVMQVNLPSNNKQPRCLLVDGESLNEERIKYLNSIDRSIPNMPVILLARKEGNDTQSDQSVIILDKEKFLGDFSWAESTLRGIVCAAST
ncbi:response regulator [bacterium]|nr:response regulator [bacterium]